MIKTVILSALTSIFSGSDVGDHWRLKASPLRSIAGIDHGGFIRHDNRRGAVDRTRDRVIDELWADDRAFIAVPPAAVPLVSSR